MPRIRESLAADWPRERGEEARAGIDAKPPSTMAALLTTVAARDRWFVLTGAGCSTDSGIPAYRDRAGTWQHRRPIRFQDFVQDAPLRERYWARSMSGFPHVTAARPNLAHTALTRLQQLGKVSLLVTQNVDGLHQKAHSEDVLELHGSLREVTCLSCRAVWSRARFQEELLASNPDFIPALAPFKPDGDADVEPDPTRRFQVPSCRQCGGLVKPHVVFFGEGVPEARVAKAYAAVASSDGVLVVGSSLAVFSGYRFVKAGAQRGVPIVVINQGVGRADALCSVRLDAPCGAGLEELTARLQLLSGAPAVAH